MTDQAGHEVGNRFFAREGTRLVLRRPSALAMLTRDARVIRQDRLGDLLEPRAPPATGPCNGFYA